MIVTITKKEKENQTNTLDEQPVVKTEESSEISDLQHSKAELEKKILYLHAEVENVRKRLQKEKLEYAKIIREAMLNDFFTVFLTLSRALNHHDGSPDNLQHVAEGSKMTMKEIEKLFHKHGLKQITGVNCAFDPHKHEALESEEKEGLQEKMVLEEYEPGFTVHDQLVRAAKVKVGIPIQKNFILPNEGTNS